MPPLELAPAVARLPNPAGYPTYIFIAGLQATALVRIASLSITDVLNEQPNTASLTVNLTPHAVPTPPFNPDAFDHGAYVTTPTPSVYPSIRRGQPIEIYSGGLTAEQLIFAGVIVAVRQIYEGQKPALVAMHLSCTDHTRALNRRKVTKSYPTQSVTAIVLDLMATFAAGAGFTTAYVQPGLPSVAIDFTFEDMNRALTRLANRIGAYWYVDYTKALHFFLAEPVDAPSPLVPGEPFAALQFETDLSQVRTRVVVEGAGTNVATDLKTGETVIPVRDPVMFPASGGLAIIGQQRITYTGVVTGGAGTLIGPGAQPGSAPVASAIQGTGIDIGTHAYAVTYTSASGESLPSPIASVTVGKVDPPATALTTNPPTAGNGPNPGPHTYAVTFITASGETTNGPGAAVTTTQAGGVPIPGATSAALRQVTGNLAIGVSYRYGTTITTASGETLGGPMSAAITPAAPPAPTTVSSQSPNTINQTGAGLEHGRTYSYYLAYLAGAYETGLSPQFNVTALSPIQPIVPANPSGSMYGMVTAGGGSMASGTYWYGLSYVYGSYESAVELFASGTGITIQNPGNSATAWGLNNSGDARCTGIRFWRTKAGIQGTYYLDATLANVTGGTQSYTDTKADASLGAARPHLNTIGTPPDVGVAMRFPSFTPSPNPKVTGMRLYRYVPGSADYRIVNTFASNVSVEYIDTKADGALGTGRGSNTGPIGTPPGDQATVTIPSSADPRAVGRKIYRSDNGAPFRFLATISNTSATQYIDNTASVAANPDAPTTDSTGGALTCVVPLTNIPIGPAGVTGRRLYRTTAAGSVLYLLTTIANNTATTFTDTRTDADLGATAPGTNTTINQQVALSKIPTGGAGVTARKVYRTAANAAQLRFLVTIGDNTTTTATDAAADATLGANVPTTDTSGLQQPQGQVNAGATAIPVSSTVAFAAAGGFAVVGNGTQVLRYTGITTTALTGVPPSGPGSLTSTVGYNSSITVAPALTGVPASGPGAISARGIVDGEEIHLIVERTDAAAQAALAAIEGGDGIIEHYIQDRRLSHAGATATADAELQLFSAPEIRVTYTTRDPRTRSGKTIAINLPAPTSLTGAYLIQRVQFSQFDLPGLPPLRAVQASSTRFSFEDVLRRLEMEISS